MLTLLRDKDQGASCRLYSGLATLANTAGEMSLTTDTPEPVLSIAIVLFQNQIKFQSMYFQKFSEDTCSQTP